VQVVVLRFTCGHTCGFARLGIHLGPTMVFFYLVYPAQIGSTVLFAFTPERHWKGPKQYADSAPKGPLILKYSKLRPHQSSSLISSTTTFDFTKTPRWFLFAEKAIAPGIFCSLLTSEFYWVSLPQRVTSRWEHGPPTQGILSCQYPWRCVITQPATLLQFGLHGDIPNGISNSTK